MVEKLIHFMVVRDRENDRGSRPHILVKKCSSGNTPLKRFYFIVPHLTKRLLMSLVIYEVNTLLIHKS